MPRQPRGSTLSSGTQIQVLREELDTANKRVDRYVHLVASLSEELDNLRRSICQTCKSRFVPSYPPIPTTSQNQAGPRPRIAHRQPQSASPGLPSVLPTNVGGLFNKSITVQQNQTNTTILVPPKPTSSAIPRQPSTAPAVGIQSQQPDWSVSHNPKIKQALQVDLVKTSNFAAKVYCVKFSPDDKYLAVGLGSNSGKTYIYDVGKGSNVCCVVDLYLKDSDQSKVWCVQFSSDNKYIATASSQQIRIWDIERKRTRAAFPTGFSSVCFSPNGRFLVASGGVGVHIFSLRDGSSTLLGEYMVVFSVAFSPDGRHIATMDLICDLRLWDARTGQLLDRWNALTSSGSLMAFTPDGKALVTGGKTLRYWDLSSLAEMKMGRDRVIGGTPGKRFQQIRKFECQALRSRASSISLSPDYQWIAVGLEESVQIWDLHTAEWQCTLSGHAHIPNVDFSPCGKYLASWGSRQVRIWKYRKV